MAAGVTTGCLFTFCILLILWGGIAAGVALIPGIIGHVIVWGIIAWTIVKLAALISQHWKRT